MYACCNDSADIFQMSIPSVVAMIPLTYVSSSTSPATSTATSGSIFPASATGTATAIPTKSNHSKIIAISVAVPIGVILLLAVMFLVWRRHRGKTALGFPRYRNPDWPSNKVVSNGRTGYGTEQANCSELSQHHEQRQNQRLASRLDALMGDSVRHELPT